ncbi:hypothetical protein PTT_11999 [Pyrenophora teres f. teres 0-1]|uniref:Uncharacterized protein n=1 Tax=Pyrenophora teres f. teres (strain 0-1) TaxID=861557 RepID=E3RSS1_PYRTT|nr:hypothetical protein PTT_11999 [Pyrenophora teres f. teres 0-1]
MLNNAYNNDAAIKKLSSKYGFVASHRRLRYTAHTINLVGQAVMFGSNKDAFDNEEANIIYRMRSSSWTIGVSKAR